MIVCFLTAVCAASLNNNNDNNPFLVRQNVNTSTFFDLTLLLFPRTPFLELGQFAGYDMYDGADIPAAGIVTGVGRIHGQECTYDSYERMTHMNVRLI